MLHGKRLVIGLLPPTLSERRAESMKAKKAELFRLEFDYARQFLAQPAGIFPPEIFV